MKWFYNMKIGKKLVITFILIALFSGIIGVIGIENINSISNKDKELYQENTLPLTYLTDMGMGFERMRINIVYLMYKTSNSSEYLQKIKDREKTIRDAMALYEKTALTDEESKEYNSYKSDFEKYIQLRDQLISLVQQGNIEQALTINTNDVYPLGGKIEESIDKLTVLTSNDAKIMSDQNTETAKNALIEMLVIIAAAILLAILLGIFVSRIISNPVKKLAEAADKLAAGDINVNVEASTKDEIGELMKSFKKMIDNIREQALAVGKIADGDLTVEVEIKSENDLLGKKLNQMIETNNQVLGNINASAEQVAVGAKQVSSSSMALSQGATEQASSIEELTASIEEVSSQTKLNAENANQANELAEAAKENAVQGNDQMQEMLKAMEEINEASSNISKIIKVIDEIAFQTNILALNAAVEAARAGEHGMGFAVVAGEVRNLAARSANAAKETTAMIEGSIKKVEVGTKIANETAVALNRIVKDVSQAASLVSDIAVASNEQATGIAQITQGISQVSQVVQTNTATSEESAAASEELSSQAEVLKEQVSRFKLKQNIQSYNKFENLNPEVMRMLESMMEKKRNNSITEIDYSAEAAVTANKIILSDREFGKY